MSSAAWARVNRNRGCWTAGRYHARTVRACSWLPHLATAVTTLVSTGGDAIEPYIYTQYGVLTICDAGWSDDRSSSS